MKTKCWMFVSPLGVPNFPLVVVESWAQAETADTNKTVVKRKQVYRQWRIIMVLWPKCLGPGPERGTAGAGVLQLCAQLRSHSRVGGARCQDAGFLTDCEIECR